MGQTPTGSEPKDQEQILDEIGIASVKERIKQLRAEVETFTETKAALDLTAKENPERFETHLNILKLQARDYNHRPITPTKQYETLPEYLELVQKTLQYKVVDEQRKYDENEKRFKKQVEAIIEQLESSQSQLDKELAKLKEAGVSE
jgi:hypothetical protein